MKVYKFFRVLSFLCLSIIICFSVLYYKNIVSSENFAIGLGLIAILAGFFGIFAIKPIEKKDFSIAVDQVLLKYDEKTFRNLKEAKEQEQKIRNFIDHQSNEMFLLKLRSYIEEEILSKYNNSDIAKLINELEEIEAQLDSINVDYGEIKLPDRFKKLLKSMKRKEKLNLYLDLLEALPFFPLKKFYKVSLKLWYSKKERIL